MISCDKFIYLEILIIIMKCPHCYSIDFVINGYSSSKKKRFKCKNCKRTFGNDANPIYSNNIKKGYPPVSIPFEFIALMLYRYKDFKEKKGFSSYVNRYLKMIGKKPVHRTATYLWIKKYGHLYKNIISFEDANNWYWKQNLILPYKKQKKSKEVKLLIDKIEKPDKKLYGEFLYWLEKELGFKYNQIGYLERKHPKAFEKLKEIFKEKLIYENIQEISRESYSTINLKIKSKK